MRRFTSPAAVIGAIVCCAVLWVGCGKSGGKGWVEVTSQVKSRLAHGAGQLTVGNELAGGDPAFGVVKSLRVEFRLNGKFQAAVVAEGSTVELPEAANILKAYYGNLPADKRVPRLDTPLPANAWLDVTDRVLSRLADRTRPLTVGNELAEGDPAPNVVKSLRVEFRLNGQVQTNEVAEGKILELPEGAEVLKAIYGDLPH
jgi:hypothetical protein